MHRLYSIIYRAVLAGRLWRWNHAKGVHIAKPEFLSSSLRIELRPDGFAVGGVVTVLPGARISDGVILAPYGGSITIGRNVYIGPYAVLYGHGGLFIGDDVMIAAHTTIVPTNHSFSSSNQPIRSQPASQFGITIMDDVWIGSGVCILDGVTIGRGSVIGASSVVTKSVPDYSIAVGVPAKVIRTRHTITTELT